MRIAFRTLWRSPAFAATAVGTIALAMSLAATVFAVVDGVLFKPLPYRAPEQLFRVSGTDGGSGYGPLATADIEYMRAADPRIQFTSFSVATRGFRHEARPDLVLNAVAVADDFFDVLGQRPLAGGFSRAHYQGKPIAGDGEPAIVSYAVWRDRLGADPAAIGRVADLLDARVLVVGVLPHDFVFPEWSRRARPDFLVPLIPPEADQQNRWNRPWMAIARIDPGLPATEAKAKLDTALAAHAGEYPPRGNQGTGPYTTVVMQALESSLGRAERPLFGAAFAGAALLVLLACVSVSGLLMARSHDRQRELSVRAALGASRSQLARLVLAEALAIACIAALVGLAAARPLLSATLTMLPESLLLLKAPVIDLRVVVFAFAAALVTMLVVSSLSLSSVWRSALARSLAGMQTSTTRMRSWARAATLAVESAVGLTLVIAGSLVLASFVTLRAEHPGIDPEGLAILDVLTPGATRTSAPEEWRSRHAAILARIQSLPGVIGAATAATPLLENSSSGSTFMPPPGAGRLWVNDIPVSGGFFDVSKIAILDGRLPTPDEIDAGRPLAVVSEQTARAYWPGRRAIGEVLQSPMSKVSVTVVAVVAEARFSSQAEKTMGELYVPAPLVPRGTPLYYVRSSRDPDMLAREVALAVNRDVEGVVVRRAQSFDDALASSVTLYRFRGTLFGTAAAAGLLLLAVGVAGLVAMGVARRVRELGIRVTLGAQRGQLGRMIVTDHLRPVLVGAALGLIASWWTTKLLSGFLYGFEAHDPWIWMTATASLVAVATLAAWIPARRASRVDPAVILRVE